ncbi:MAG: helix-turn-helix transcriptional regulator [Victivallales bacterium]|nr:helix-turn-helix transcriptional regulator [Victivallales bacterium]
MENDIPKLPASWKLLLEAECAPVTGRRLSSSVLQWLNTHEHSHVYREILVVVKGRCLLQVAGKIVQVKRGEMLLLESGVSHTHGHLPDDKAVFWWCMLVNGQLRILLWRHNRIDAFLTLDIGAFSRVLESMADDLRQAGSMEAARKELREIISALLGNFFRRGQIPVPYSEKYTNQDEAIRKVMIYIDVMPVLKCSLKSAAALANYSPSHFQRLFRQYANESFRDYIQRKRLERYYYLCEKGVMPKKEIAYVLGFSSIAALNHWERNLK